MNKFSLPNIFTKDDSVLNDMKSELDALNKSQATIQFSPDGVIITANENFLNTVGYKINEIIGNHHSMFVEQGYESNPEYKQFWRSLARGEYQAAEYKRICKDGSEIWLQASYNPILDETGSVVRIIKYATDITERKIAADINFRITQATQGAKANIMLADKDNNIVYMNKTMVAMLQNAESDIKKALPNFNANDLMGKNIDVFHKNPAHQRRLLETLVDTFETKIVVAVRTFVLIANPILDGSGERIGTSVEWDDITSELEAKEKADERSAANARIKVALDKCTTNVMMADADRNIIYVNDAVMEMLVRAERDLQEVLPNFRANEVLGSNIDIFHKNPSHQKNVLEGLTGTYRSEITVGKRMFGLIANPVTDDDNVRLGTVVEWDDVTAERNAETEIGEVVNSIGNGDFTSRIEEAGKNGFMLNIAEGINAIASTCEKGLTEVVAMLRALSEGNLTNRIETEYQGTFDELKQDSNTTAERLTEIVTSIAASADEVSTAASQISEGSVDLSERTESQASALEETAAAMEQMAATVKTNSENAQQANQLSMEASDVASKGGKVVDLSVVAMAAIEESSQKISDIIGVIDEIAFQTNLLALNAAVEAARAGDAGRGFAVVASEVRTLAQRSSEAAKDIKTLIVDSGNQVKDGVKLVGETGETLADILKSIKNVTDIVSDIAAASEEQATGIEEINTSVTEMDDMTQQNSALVEENAAASKSMVSQARTMNDEMAFFNVGDDGAVSQKRLENPSSTSKKSTKKKAPKKIEARKKNAPKKAPTEEDDWSEF